MSIYGEGLYRDRNGNLVEDAQRPVLREGQADWDPLDADGHPLSPVPTPEWKRPALSSIYALNKYVSSFVGIAPASRPRLIVAVMIDEPTAGQYYGGAVAAPVFSQVAAGALRLLAVAPDAPVDNVVLPPPDAPEIKEEV